MTSNEDTVGLVYEANEVNPSPLYSAFFIDSRNDFAVSNTFIELLKGERGSFDVDPRLQKYAAPYRVKDKDGNYININIESVQDNSYTESADINDYQGMPYGIDNSVTASQLGTESPFSSNVLKQDYTEIFMEYAEVEFLLSEANGWSDANYKKGVTASMERWGVEPAKITAFVNALPAANMENVLTQKYIALYMQPYEAWAEYRRTGYPKTLLLPGQKHDLNAPLKDGTTDYTFQSLITGLTDLPSRLFYPVGVQTKNGENYKAAVQNIGGDEMNTKLIWDKN